MQRVLGFGGLIFRAREPRVLGRWYERHFGIDPVRKNRRVWRQEPGPTVFVPFQAREDYFGYFDNPDQAFMLNFRVEDLDAMLEQLRADGVRIDARRMTESIGRFAWVYDPEGNKVELWEPNYESQTLRKTAEASEPAARNPAKTAVQSRSSARAEPSEAVARHGT